MKAASSRLVICVLLATSVAERDEAARPKLGALIHARGAVHALNRTELEAELAERGAARFETDSEDELRLRLYHAREQLLQQRTTQVMQAETIMAEVALLGDEQNLASLSLDSVLADDNAIFMIAMGNRMLESLKMQAGIGALVGLILTYSAPLGRMPHRVLFLPISYASSIVQNAAVCLAGGVVLAALQLVLKHVRRWASAPSYFCQKLAAVTCRNAAVEWMLETEAQQTQPNLPARATKASGKHGIRPLWRRRGVLLPVVILAMGSSIFEEVLFRGVFLHLMIVKARWPAALATAVTSFIFGLMHVRNEDSLRHSAIYAAWTFAGGVIFSAAYLGTRGGLVAPILLHFGLNALIFGHSSLLVGAKLLADRRGSQSVMARAVASAQRRPASHGGSGAAGAGMARSSSASERASMKSPGRTAPVFDLLHQRGFAQLHAGSADLAGDLFLLA